MLLFVVVFGLVRFAGADVWVGDYLFSVPAGALYGGLTELTEATLPYTFYSHFITGVCFLPPLEELLLRRGAGGFVP